MSLNAIMDITQAEPELLETKDDKGTPTNEADNAKCFDPDPSQPYCYQFADRLKNTTPRNGLEDPKKDTVGAPLISFDSSSGITPDQLPETTIFPPKNSTEFPSSTTSVSSICFGNPADLPPAKNGKANSETSVIWSTPNMTELNTSSLESLRYNPRYISNGGPGEMVIEHEQLKCVLNGFKNLYLAHEVALNEEFHLKPYTPKKHGIEARVTEQFKKAYWELLDESLLSNPPNYKYALAVLKEIKKELLDLLLPHNNAMRQRITEHMDLELIEHQIQHNAFGRMEFQAYADFIISAIAELCCPARDADVEALKEIRVCTKVFQGILETIDKMKVDMGNYLLQQTRPLIIKQCVRYERMKLADQLEMQYELKLDGLHHTRIWLNSQIGYGRQPDEILAKAFTQLVQLNITPRSYPETMMLDAGRLHEIALQLERLNVIAAIIMSIGTMFQALFDHTFTNDLRDKIKRNLKLLLTTIDLSNSKTRLEALYRLGEAMCKILNEHLMNSYNRSIVDVERSRIKECVLDVDNSDHKFRRLLNNRIMEYVEVVASNPDCSSTTTTIPSALQIIQIELLWTISQFRRIVNHSHRVYDEIYFAIIQGDLLPPTFPTELEPQMDPKYQSLLSLLRADACVDQELCEKQFYEDTKRIQEASSQLPDGIS